MDLERLRHCFYHKRCLSKKTVKAVEVYDIKEVEESLDNLRETLENCLFEIERLDNLVKKLRGNMRERIYRVGEYAYCRE
jgi:hypothetical protein